MMKKAFLFLWCLVFFLVGCSRFFEPISGRVLIQDTALEGLANQPNAVCYLMLKDEFGVPVVIKRWLNPRFPLNFNISKSDLLLLTRPWKGPFWIEAHLFLSLNLERELPPPPGTISAKLDHPVYPGEDSIRLVLRLALDPQRRLGY